MKPCKKNAQIGENMNIMQCKHLDFVPSKIVKDATDNSIYVFTRQLNGRLYKRKKFFCGRIFLHPKTKKWSFCPIEGNCFGFEFLSIVAMITRQLDGKVIKYDAEKGEIEKL